MGEKIKTTNEKVVQLALAIDAWLRKDSERRQKLRDEASKAKPGEDNKVPSESKFNWALKKMRALTKPVLQSYGDESERINIENCAEGFAADGKTKIILQDSNNAFQFSKEQLAERSKKMRELNRVTPVEIETYMAQGDIPEDLTDAERDAFAGFVLPREAEEE